MVANSSYSASIRQICELFGDYLEGPADCPVLVIGKHSTSWEGSPADALAKSFAALGLGDEACTFAALSLAEDGPVEIDPEALFLLVEGMDPVHIVCVDQASIDQVAAAYRTQFNPDSAGRVFGRPAVLFANLGELLKTERGKRTAWELLKTLPR